MRFVGSNALCIRLYWLALCVVGLVVGWLLGLVVLRLCLDLGMKWLKMDLAVEVVSDFGKWRRMKLEMVWRRFDWREAMGWRRCGWERERVWQDRLMVWEMGRM